MKILEKLVNACLEKTSKQPLKEDILKINVNSKKTPYEEYGYALKSPYERLITYGFFVYNGITGKAEERKIQK